MAGFPREMAALVRQSNAAALAERLALTSADASKRQFVDYMKTKSYTAVLSESERVMSADWADVVCHSVKAAIGVIDQNLCEAYMHQEASVEAYLRIFKTLTKQWLPVLKQLLIDLRKLGGQVDKELRADGKGTEACKLESAGRIMRKMLAQELRDEENDKLVSRTQGALFVANQCNKVFFALNTLKHVRSLVLPPMMQVHEYPTPDRVTWSYFQGRMALMESRFEEAEKDLAFAFNNCPAAYASNRRLILSYLVPVRLLLHQNRPSPTRRAALPSAALLQQYKLVEFDKLVQAFRSGNVKLFDEALEENQDFYIKKAIYFLLHKLKLCVYRNLFKKAYNIIGKSQIKLEVLVCAVRAAGGDADDQQVECMLANLIHQGLVKGYIAHKQQVVVLKKDDPFRVNA